MKLNWPSSIPHALNMQGMKIVGFHMGMFMHGLMRSLKQSHELLKTIILEQMREIKTGTKGGGIIKLINLHLLYHYSCLFLTFSK
jgi:hypothetical protein